MRASNYIFSSTQVRVLEKQLLSSDQLSRIISSDSLQEAMKFLSETRFGLYFPTNAPITDYESILQKDHVQLHHVIGDISPKPSLTKYLQLKYFYADLKKSLTKYFHNSKDSKNDFEFTRGFPSIMVDHEDQSELVQYTNAQTAVNNLIKRAKLLYIDSKSPYLVANTFDKAFHLERLELSKSIESEFIQNFTVSEIDFINISLMFRMKRQNQHENLFSSFVINGGFINADELVALYSNSEGFQEATVLAASSGCNEYILKAMNDFEASNDLSLFERSHDQFLLSSAHKALNFTYGPEVIFGYAKIVETEIQNLRIILSGKKIGMSPEKIKQYVRLL